jgi:hypothetical protein
MRCILACQCMVLSVMATAQLDRKEIRTDSGLVVLHHLRNGMVSTLEWTDKDGRWGRARAFDQNGREIFAYQTRSIGGHATVRFSYHPNGAISKAEVSDAPDGGIQWYRSTTTFDEGGVRTGFSEQGHDDHGPIPGPGTVRETRPALTPVKRPADQEVMTCQKLYVNEVFVVNRTNSACRVKALAKAPSPALPSATYTLAPGDTVRLGTYSIGEAFAPPEQHVVLGFMEVTLDRTGSREAITETTSKTRGPEHQVYLIHIMDWADGEPPRPAPKVGPSTPKQGGTKRDRWWKFWQ